MGVSFYRSASQCVRRSRLDKESRDRQHDTPLPFALSDYADDASGITLGKTFHGLTRVYYGSAEEVATEVSDMNLGDAIADAMRLFAAYKQRFKPSDFAEIVAVEQPFPRDEREAQIIREAMGVDITFRPDMVVRLEQAHCERLATQRMLNGLQPGYYLWDFKTMASKSSHAELFYRADPQFRGYQFLWNLLNPQYRVNGMVADCIVNYKKQDKLEKDGFFSILVPYPTQRQILGFQKWIQRVRADYDTNADSFNLSACFNYHRPCPYLLNGACDQS